jgi:hypothetical protein
MKRWVIGALIAAAAITIFVWGRTQFRIDRCLDAGGSWNSQAEKCDR